MDADWAGDKDESKSTSSYLFFISCAAFSWSSQKQKLTTQSSMEAEYIGLCSTSNQAVVLQEQHCRQEGANREENKVLKVWVVVH